MEAFFLHTILWSWILIFGTLAFAPLMLDGKKKSSHLNGLQEDRVVRFEDRAIIERRLGVRDPQIGDEERPAA